MRISAKHRQYDVAAAASVDAADDNDEDNQPQPFPHFSPALEHPNPHNQLPSCNCLKKEPLLIDPIGPEIWEKWSLERSIVGMASRTFSQRNCLYNSKTLKYLTINQIHPNSNLRNFVSSNTCLKNLLKTFLQLQPQQIIVTVYNPIMTSSPQLPPLVSTKRPMKASTQSRLKLIARLRPTAEPILMVFQMLGGIAKGVS